MKLQVEENKFFSFFLGFLVFFNVPGNTTWSGIVNKSIEVVDKIIYFSRYVLAL